MAGGISARGPAPRRVPPRRAPTAACGGSSPARDCAWPFRSSPSPGGDVPQRDRDRGHPPQLPADRDRPHRLGTRRPGGERQRLRTGRPGRAGRANVRIRPRCDVWLAANGAEERLNTGWPDHLGALALARRARAHGARSRLRRRSPSTRWRRDRPFWLRSPAPAPRPGVEIAVLRAARLAGCPSAGCGTRAREFRPPRVRAARPSRREARGGRGGEPCRHTPCDRPSRLDRTSLRLARRMVERALLGPAPKGPEAPSVIGRAPDHGFL